jgi:hypothetical protein
MFNCYYILFYLALPEFYCSDSPCLNEGRCLPHDPIGHDHPEHGAPHPYDKPHVDHFTCQCIGHWTGVHCETGNTNLLKSTCIYDFVFCILFRLIDSYTINMLNTLFYDIVWSAWVNRKQNIET